MEKVEFVREGDLLISTRYYELLKRNRLNHFRVLYDLTEGELFKKNPPLSTRLKSILTGFRIREGAENEWDNILRLEEAGIRTMPPVAFGSIWKGGLPYQALTLTEHLYGADKLEHFLPEHFGGETLAASDITLKRRIILETARWARRFHEAGFHHQDFYLGHIFIRFETKEDFSLHLIDLQRVRESTRLRISRVIKDLAQMNFSALQLSCLTRADRLRFFKVYVEKNRLGRSEKDLIRRIEQKTRRISLHTQKLLARRAQQRSVKPTSPERKGKSKAPF
jgi:hypothetical protein